MPCRRRRHGAARLDHPLTYVDPAITGIETPSVANDEPLMISTPTSTTDHPEATTEIPNLFLAAGYVPHRIDQASMEGAGEAGRRAANGILDATDSAGAPSSRFPPLPTTRAAAVLRR